MRKMQILSACFLLLCCGLIAGAQNINAPQSSMQNSLTIESELKNFFDEYARELRENRGATIAERYDKRGYYRMGNGTKTLVSFEDNKKRYVNGWIGPKTFEWKNLSIEVLSADSAIVTGLFDWQIGSSESRTYSYTGLLTKQSGKWLIRLEDESGAGLTSVTPISGASQAAGAFKYLYNASAGASLSAHRHSVDQRITVRSGRKYILMGDLETAKVQRFEAGASLVIPANTWHIEWWETKTVEEIQGIGPMRTEMATPATPRVP